MHHSGVHCCFFTAGESEVPGGEQCLGVHQESGGQNQRRGRKSNTLSGQNHRGSRCQGTGSLSTPRLCLVSLSLCLCVSLLSLFSLSLTHSVSLSVCLSVSLSLSVCTECMCASGAVNMYVLCGS